VDVGGKDEEGYMVLFLVARWGREATVELLVEKYGANPEVGNGGMEWTSLHGAVILKNWPPRGCSWRGVLIPTAGTAEAELPYHGR